MPALKPETIARKRQKLTKLVLEHNGSPNAIAEALGTSKQNVAQAIERYNIKSEILKYSEELGFGNKEAAQKIINHINSESPNVSLDALGLWLKHTNKATGSDSAEKVEINTHQINVITSKSVADAMSRYRQLVP